MTTATRRFQVALSFPGEHRPLIAQIAECLASHIGKDAVFYDKYHEAELASENLDLKLQTIYHDESELLAIFLCAAYERKNWCGLEWRAIRDLMANRTTPARMFFRVDSGKVPGFFDGIDGYIATENRSPEELASLVLERLRLERGTLERGTPVEQDTTITKQGLEALGDLMESPAVKAAVEEYQGELVRTSEQIATLGQYKEVHDQLHSLQVHCYTPIWQEFRRFPGKPIAWDRLEDYAYNLENVATGLEAIAEKARFRQAEKERVQTTVKTLLRACEELAEAIRKSDPKQLERTALRLRQVLATQPDYFATNLSQMAKHLDLENLTRTLESLSDKLDGHRLDPEKLKQFEEGIAALGRLSVELIKMIDNHDRWQEQDTNLRRIDELPDEQFEQELDWSWEDVRDRTRGLSSGGPEPWEALIADKTAELGQVIRGDSLRNARAALQLVAAKAAELGQALRVDTAGGATPVASPDEARASSQLVAAKAAELDQLIRGQSLAGMIRSENQAKALASFQLVAAKAAELDQLIRGGTADGVVPVENLGKVPAAVQLIVDKAGELDEVIRVEILERIRAAFQKYRGWAVQRFYRVDRDLLKHCEKLCEVGEPLDSILRRER
jgi:ribosomal protein L10